MTRIWSDQQRSIFTFVVDGKGHLIVRARAGTGKTTTIVEAVRLYLQAHPGQRVVVCAFNTRIADELRTKFIGLPVEVKTLHAIGMGIVRRMWTNVLVESKENRGERAKGLTEKACGPRVPDAIKKLVTRLHTLGREIAPHAQTGADLLDIAFAFDCGPDEEWQEAGWTIEQVCSFAASAMFHAEARPVAGIDFSDMIFLPVRHRWLYKWADLVLVDEGQDMTVSQLEIAQGICRGRMGIIGDDRQAIYGFRGADSGSLDRLKAELDATELGLTTTYRCGKLIVEAARELVPDFEAGATNPDGEILTLPEGKLVDAAQPGDFILSRTNAPLVTTAMALLRAGIRARVAGKSIGDDICRRIRTVGKGASGVPAFLAKLAAWEKKETSRAIKGAKSPEAAERRIEAITDEAEMIRNLADGATSVHDVEDRAEALFTDDGLGQAGVVTCSSVHRAKGLEADRVFVLADTLRNQTIEELNIHYVAITRAKRTLVMVSEHAADTVTRRAA